MNGNRYNINEGFSMVAEAKGHEKSCQYDQASRAYQRAAYLFNTMGENKLHAQCQVAHAVNMIKYYLEERDIEAFSVNYDELYIKEIEEIMDIDLSKFEKYDILFTAYRELEKVFHDVNRIDKESELYYKRMSLYHLLYWEKFKQKDKTPKVRLKFLYRFFFRGFLHCFYKHGEKPGRVFLWIFAAIISFATVYKMFNLIEFTDPQKTVCFWQSLYYSVVTFTTLGYGDIVPTCLFGQLLAIFEVLLGILTISLFIPLIIKKLE